MRQVVFVDTETTGLDPAHHNVWEIGLIEETGEEHVWIRNTDMIDLGTADSTALRINRFYERGYTIGQPTVRDNVIARQFAELSAGKYLVGIVPSFDATFLTKFLVEAGIAPAWHYQLVDAEAMLAGSLGVAPPWDLRRMIDDAGGAAKDIIGHALATEAHHTAIGDARVAKAIYETALLLGKRRT